MEFEQLERFTAFLKENLSTPDFDEDAYLERLIIHWGETGALRFTLSAEETVSGAPAHIAYTVDNRYFIREDGKEIPVEDLDQGYDLYRPVLRFLGPAETPEEESSTGGRALNPIALIRHKSGKTLKSVSALSGIDPERILSYEKPDYDIGSLPLSTAAALAKALNVHAEDLLACAPTMPRGR